LPRPPECENIMLEMKTVPRLVGAIEVVRIEVRKRTARWLEHDEGARYHRCQIASEAALRELECIKSGTRSDSYRTSFMR
jgi:hypothetical protein